MRGKIIAGNLGIVLMLGLIAYFTVSGELKSQLTEQLNSDIDNDRVLFERSFRLSALEFVDQVTERASIRQLRNVFGGLDEDSRRTRAFEAAQATQAWITDPARGRGGADIIVVTDETGKALARDGARNVMFGKKMLEPLPALARVLKDGVPAHDLWRENQHNKVLQTAMAPIRADSGTVIGALIVGYDVSNGMASREGKLLGRDIAFVTGDKVYSSSLEGGEPKELKDFLFGPNKASTEAVLGDQGTSRMWSAKLAGSDYVGLTARLPMSPSMPVAFAVLGNRTEQVELATAAQIIIILMVLCGLMAIAYNFVISNTIMRPIEVIEEGVLAVINGNTDLRLETDSKELGGIAFRINQLLNVFTGTSEESEDGEGRISVRPSASGGGDWNDAAFADSASGGASGAGGAAPASGAGGADEPIDDPALAERLAGEDEAGYEQRVHGEYVAAKQAIGENVSNIPKDRFAQRLKGRGEALAKKHGCRLVRFQVQTANNQVVLRPVLIR